MLHFIASSILSGIIWDIMKGTPKVVQRYFLKKNEIDEGKLENLIASIPQNEKNSKDVLVNYLKSDEEYQILVNQVVYKLQKVHKSDMYPFYWTSSERGIFMRYSYEFKRKAVELYRQGKWIEPPADITNLKNFHDMIVRWHHLEKANSPDCLKHHGKNKKWAPEEKYELVAQVIAGATISSVAYAVGINTGLLAQWIRKYKIWGYNGLVDRKKGRKPKEPTMKKMNINNPHELEESEYEELIRLRAENAYIKAENEVIKKEIALREEKEAALLKAKKQRLSKNSEKKDIN